MLLIAPFALAPPLRDGPSCASGGQFPNIAFLGHGYDIVLGNPQPWVSNSGGAASGKAFDPGWETANVIDMEDYTGNGHYDGCAIPNAVINNIVKTESCEYSATFSELGDASSYQHQLHTDASVHEHAGAFGWGESFSSSADYDSLDEAASSSQSIFFSNAAICQMYEAGLPDFLAVNLTKNFRAGVAVEERHRVETYCNDK